MKEETKSQSRLEDQIISLDRDYELAEYPLTVRDRKQRQILTKYRPSDHKLAIEQGRHKKSWQTKENRTYGNCSTGEVETEMHFLLKYESLDETFILTNSVLSIPNFNKVNDTAKQKERQKERKKKEKERKKERKKEKRKRKKERKKKKEKVSI